MTAVPASNLFAPTRSKHESKAEATTKAALNIIDTEAAKRVAKTERLRAARLAQEEAVVEAPPVKPKRTVKKK